MPPQQISLTESEREALAIRWRRLLILALLDYFNGSNDFGTLILKELVDLREAVIKAYARNNGISLRRGNGWKSLGDIINELREKEEIPEGVKSIIKQSEDIILTQTISSQQSIKDLRNEETHYLNTLDVRRETILRIWRMFYEFVEVIDPEFFEYTKNRPELRDFYYLQDFFWKVVLCQEPVDLSKLKVEEISVPVGMRTVRTTIERGVWEIIDNIRKGHYVF